MSHTHAGNIDMIKRIPRPDEPLPRLAAPTVALFVAALSAWCGSTALAVTGAWPWPISTVINAVAAFALFTVLHEASHSTLSTNVAVNTWLGRVAAVLLAPPIGYRTFRFIHMQHHRFTNQDDGNDPDRYTMRGPSWQAPLRWLTIDGAYVTWYLPRLRGRPRAEQRETFVMLVFAVVAVSALVASGNFLVVGLTCWLVPARLAILFLGWSFDYLPHHGLTARPSEDPFKTTRNRVGLERLLSPIMLYQNYHLVHHLHPVIPFYRYIAVWRRSEDEYLAQDPALSTVRGRPLTVAEYRALREMS
jgi:ring-1,2-phenylacetyl-CoA epoxidase subunit PaaE